MNKDKIFNRQIEALEKGKKVLNILCGEVLLADFMDNGVCLDQSLYIPFNESICEGEVDKNIFSKEFIKKRAKSLCVTQNYYIQNSSQKLEILNEGDFGIIHLWFGTDMFCIMNMVVLLAYLDQIENNCQVYISFLDEPSNEISGLLTEVKVKGFKEIYLDIFFNLELNAPTLPTVFVNGINNYLKYRSKENEIVEYILNNEDLSKSTLIGYFLKHNKSLGLTDDAYSRLIDKIRLN